MKKQFTLSLIATCLVAGSATAAVPQQSDVWYKDAQSAIENAKKNTPIIGQAKNVIVFIGDGMSLGTITAARIYVGQQNGSSGEENILTMETLPHVALSKTYNTDMQTPDSAGTATAIVTGVKTKGGIINVNDNVRRGFCDTVAGNEASSIFELAADKGKAVGVVSTARITHATPATAYAHSPDRNWENDSKIPNIAKEQGCKDIASQLVAFDVGDGFQVAFGGGRREFIPADATDPEYPDKGGKRTDGRNLIEEWQARYSDGQFVYNLDGFDSIKVDEKTRVLGLFEPSHMQYEADRQVDNKEPSLAQMTDKAIDILEQDKEGYVLMVEAGRIDHAHHGGNAARALEDTKAYDEAIKVALEKTDPKDTLIIVTADHAHTMIMNGYAERGNPILGLSKQQGKFNKDVDGNTYTTIVYGNGPGAVGESPRPSVSQEQVLKLDYLQQALVGLGSETHSGEDVIIFARGPQAWLFQGAVEQNYIYHVINDATGIGQ
ncbi:alkaline phosphatase [Enterovibrio norvegicus]|uniref:Alkaline phosphatase n=1 Tax=Enterovibrio norvegicus TaxID=188144 RepID=A0ABV4L1H7_9GAMM|nr:alkaline phosphatase [Enterovibrio norvegicus]OEF54973.1 alkaline phosphatase [Enterovibrio norvegicus]